MSLNLPPHYEQALKGRYFRAVNPTMGTGIAMGIQTTFSDTANVLFLLQNAGKQVCLDYLRLICTVAGASTTASDLAIVTDSILRYSAGGNGVDVVNAQHPSSITSAAFLSFNCTAGAASAKRKMSRLRLKTQAAPCWTVGDQIFIKFGGASCGGFGATNGTTAQYLAFDVGPVIVSPAGSLLFHMWNTANATTAPSWEIEFGWWEV